MAEQSQVSFRRSGNTILMRLAGVWRLRGGFPSAALVQRELESSPEARRVVLEAQELTSWDSSVLR